MNMLLFLFVHIYMFDNHFHLIHNQHHRNLLGILLLDNLLHMRMLGILCHRVSNFHLGIEDCILNESQLDKQKSVLVLNRYLKKKQIRIKSSFISNRILAVNCCGQNRVLHSRKEIS